MGRRGRRALLDIAHGFETLGVGPPKGFDYRFEIGGIGRIRKAVLGQAAQDATEGRPRGQPGGSLKRGAAIDDVERRHDPGLAPPQIFGRQHAARGSRVGGDRTRDFASVEIIRPGLGQPLEGIGQTPQRQPRTVGLGRTHRR